MNNRLVVGEEVVTYLQHQATGAINKVDNKPSTLSLVVIVRLLCHRLMALLLIKIMLV